MAFFLFSIAFFCVRASSITGVNDTMSRGKVGTASNHTIVFVTPSGVSEGSTMTVTFPAGFGTSGMTENDVDLLDNGLSVSTAPDCSGAEQAAAVWVGNTLSFQICPGDGGAFASGSAVTILIGTNAIDFGVGVNRIINPSAPGSYRITIGGGFGDSGEAPIALGADDSVGVTACVGDACNAGRHSLPSPSAILPPQISGVVIDQITSSTARVNWRTDTMSNSYALYGLTANHGTIIGNDFRTQSHTLTLVGLNAQLVYHIQVRSVDNFGGASLSDDYTFSTSSINNVILPQISGIRLETVGGNTATITWITNIPTYWRIDFGRAVVYENIVQNSQFNTAHTANLGNLNPNTTYHFRITATAATGDQTVSADQSFTTFDTTLPLISDIHVDNITTHSADIVWQTNKPATGGVKFGIGAAYDGGENLETVGFAISHRVTLLNLSASTLYHYNVYQTDQVGNDAQGADQVFKTAVSVLPLENTAKPAAPVAPGAPTPVSPVTIPKNAVAVGSGILQLKVNGVPEGIAANVATVVPGSAVEIELPRELTEKPIANASVSVGGNAYKLIKNTDGAFRTAFAAPQAAGNQTVMVIIRYVDGSTNYSRFNIVISSKGKIIEVSGGKTAPVAGAKVSILQNGKPWDGSKFGQNNYLKTDNKGNFVFYVPKGKYSLKIEKNGYITKITTPTSYSGVVHDTIKLLKLPKKVSIISQTSSNIIKAGDNLFGQIVKFFSKM